MSTYECSGKRYPAGRGFVLQFNPADPAGEPVFSGRIEHIVTGSVQHFVSAEGLCTALRTMLVELTNNKQA